LKLSGYQALAQMLLQIRRMLASVLYLLCPLGAREVPVMEVVGS